MNDSDQNPASNMHEFTVSELSSALKRSVETQFGHVRVRAEISGLSRPASGHMYFGLKDDKSVLDGVCWRGVAARLAFRPEDGLEVICTGKLTTYAGRSKYQMVVERMEPAGEGALMALLEDRKRILTAEGLFATERKKAIPYIPKKIGVVTSPTGAVIRDILHRLNDRFPRDVVVWPVIVQGQGAGEQIAQAIAGFNDLKGDTKPDVLIVARGGGSVEDLWAFNEEIVVRAVADSHIPLISAVGHETDTTLIDYAADKRAPTPTGAAEMIVPVKADLDHIIRDLAHRLNTQKSKVVFERSQRLKALARALPNPKDMLGLASQRLDDLTARLPRGLKAVLQNQSITLNRLVGGLSIGRIKQICNFHASAMDSVNVRLKSAANRKLTVLDDTLKAQVRILESLSFTRVLERGYVMLTNVNGMAVTSAAKASIGDLLTARFHDGDKAVTVGQDVAHVTNPKPTKGRSKKKILSSGDDKQGSLL